MCWPHARIPALKAMLDSLIANNSIDSHRNITGLSMGGMGTWVLFRNIRIFLLRLFLFAEAAI